MLAASNAERLLTAKRIFLHQSTVGSAHLR
jgi:hypothetical protein